MTTYSQDRDPQQTAKEIGYEVGLTIRAGAEQSVALIGRAVVESAKKGGEIVVGIMDFVSSRATSDDPKNPWSRDDRNDSYR